MICDNRIVESEYSADKFTDLLLTEGAKVPCDDTQLSFNDSGKLPPFYDEDKFKRGQAFYRHNIFTTFFGKLLGLLTILAVPSIVKRLIFTSRSSVPMTAYKRYMATIFHMDVWYKSDFRPGSQLWKSLSQVKRSHNISSKQRCSASLSFISQKDMALTQFGFMGYVISRPEMIGIYNAPKEDLEAFIHVWRVIGYLIGIEGRFNICKDSLVETRDICEKLIDKVFIPSIKDQEVEFLQMGTALVDGMWVMHPMLNSKVMFSYLYKIVFKSNDYNSNHNTDVPKIKLDFFGRIRYWLICGTFYAVKFDFYRLYHNYVHKLSLWLMAHFPFLAYYEYGYKNSHVHILQQKCKLN